MSFVYFSSKFILALKADASKVVQLIVSRKMLTTLPPNLIFIFDFDTSEPDIW